MFWLRAMFNWWAGHTYPPHLAMPHQSVTRSLSSQQLEAMSSPPLEQLV